MSELGRWANDNQGILAILLFGLSLGFAGIGFAWRSLHQRPRFRIETIPGPTFVSTFPTGRSYSGHETHRTAFALYLRIRNTGARAATIASVEIGYRNHTPRSLFSRFWLQPAIALSDFNVAIGETCKLFPFLFQRSMISGDNASLNLEPGGVTNGIVYFEQVESWGGFHPRVTNGQTDVLVRIRDGFGNVHRARHWIPVVTLEDARAYNRMFGQSLEQLQPR